MTELREHKAKKLGRLQHHTSKQAAKPKKNRDEVRPMGIQEQKASGAPAGTHIR